MYCQEQRCELDIYPNGNGNGGGGGGGNGFVRERESINFDKSLNVDHRKRSNNLMYGPVRSRELACTVLIKSNVTKTYGERDNVTFLYISKSYSTRS